jgi:CCR4-NOT complex subunit CAF16
MNHTIEINKLNFFYKNTERLVLENINLKVAQGERYLILGANGAGKSTMLSVIAGHHMLPLEAVRVLGRPAFHDPSLVGDVAFLGGDFPFTVDMSVSEILGPRPGVDPARQTKLLHLLEIDPNWRMHRVSSGQRRRVQLLMNLRRASKVLLLDEITTDLDVVGRADLLDFLREESEQRGATILYATHIFDGLEAWATHLLYLSQGKLVQSIALAELKELVELKAKHTPAPLLTLVTRWLREERDNRKEERGKRKE